MSYGYDAQGNTTTENGTATYGYDPFNRLGRAGSATDYVSPEGQRLRKQTSSGTTYFAPDSGGTLLAEDDNGTWVDYVWLNGRLIGRIAGSTVDAIHTDQTGRPQVVTDAGQAVVWKATNYPFEREVAQDDIGGLNLGFPGQYYDAERGLWNNGYRDYNASLGRYVESDPSGLNGGINTYVYASNNPLMYVDMYGLSCYQLLDGKYFIPKDGPIEPVYPELAFFGAGRLIYADAAALIPAISESIEGDEVVQATWAISSRNTLKPFLG
jgi:RHS repeat-associated protein